MTNIEEIEEFALYSSIRDILDENGLTTLSQIVQLLRFSIKSQSQNTKTLEILLDRDLSMDPIYRCILKIEIVKRKRELRQRKIDLILK